MSVIKILYIIYFLFTVKRVIMLTTHLIFIELSLLFD